MNRPEPGQRFTHKKRGSTYTVIGIGYLQTRHDFLDDEEVVIYQEPSGILWVRPLTEFCDGRFEAVP